MSYSGKNSILYAMMQQFGTKSKEKDRMVFNADTNTLLSAEKARDINMTTETVPDERLEYVFETRDYEEVLRGYRHFIICKNMNVKMHDNIVIYESKNFMRTGRYEIRQIIQIERSENIPGLKDGYCAIGWE